MLVLNSHNTWWQTYPIDAFDSFIVSSWQRNIFDDGKGQLAKVFAVGFLDLLGGLFTSNCRSYVVAARGEGIEDVSGDETRSSCNQTVFRRPEVPLG
jgi:hypothetical protein